MKYQSKPVVFVYLFYYRLTNTFEGNYNNVVAFNCEYDSSINIYFVS